MESKANPGSESEEFRLNSEGEWMKLEGSSEEDEMEESEEQLELERKELEEELARNAKYCADKKAAAAAATSRLETPRHDYHSDFHNKWLQRFFSSPPARNMSKHANAS